MSPKKPALATGLILILSILILFFLKPKRKEDFYNKYAFATIELNGELDLRK